MVVVFEKRVEASQVHVIMTWHDIGSSGWGI